MCRISGNELACMPLQPVVLISRAWSADVGRAIVRFPPPLIAFVLCFAALLWRCRERLLHAHLWAEDGQLFFPDALRLGYSAIFEQYGGYLHVLPRLLSATFARLPLEHYALLINLSSLTIYAGSAALLARSVLRGLIPNDGLRITGAVALCFLPGLWEILNNVANLHSAVFLAAMLLCLKDLDSPLRAWEAALFLFIGATAGEMVVLLPVFLLRGYLRWHRGESLHAQAMEWVVVSILLAWALLNGWLVSGSITPNPEDGRPIDVQLYALKVVSTLSARFLLQPLLGDEALLWMYSHREFMVLASLGSLGVLGWGLLASRNRMVVLLLLAALCAWAILPLTWIVRPGSAAAYPFLRPLDISVFEHRYAWIGTPLAIVLWLVVLQSLGTMFGQPSLAIVLCMFVVVIAWHRGKLSPFGPEKDWRGTLANLRSIPPGHFGEVPTNPGSWKIVVRGPVP
jgi:hypothetical protein